MVANKGFQSKDTESRRRLVEAGQALIAEEGCNAFSARRIAERAGLKPQLLHYYFPSMDDFLVEVYMVSANRYRVLHAKALASPTPLRSLWALNANLPDAKRVIEFMALGRRYPKMRAAMTAEGEEMRRQQIEAVADAMARKGLDSSVPSAGAVAMAMSAIARTLVMEAEIGVIEAHKYLHELIARMLDVVEPLDSDAPSPDLTEGAAWIVSNLLPSGE